MGNTPDRFPGPREEVELRLEDDGSGDPTVAGGLKYVSNRHKLKDNSAVFEPTQLRVTNNDTTPKELKDKLTGDGITFVEENDGNDESLKASLSVSNPGPNRFSINPGSLLRSGTSGTGVAEGFAVNEFTKNNTDFGAWSEFWRRGPTTSVNLRVLFALKQAGSGSYVRIAARTKAKAAGENIISAFDIETFVSISVSGGLAGDIYLAQLSLGPTNFANGEAVALNIGRDGANQVAGPGNDDDFGKSILLIATEVETV